MAESEEPELGQLQDEVKAYTEQLDALKADFKLVVIQTEAIKNAIRHMAGQSGNPNFSAELIQDCKRFVEKYGLRDY